MRLATPATTTGLGSLEGHAESAALAANAGDRGDGDLLPHDVQDLFGVARLALLVVEIEVVNDLREARAAENLLRDALIAAERV